MGTLNRTDREWWNGRKMVERKTYRLVFFGHKRRNGRGELMRLDVLGNGTVLFLLSLFLLVSLTTFPPSLFSPLFSLSLSLSPSSCTSSPRLHSSPRHRRRTRRNVGADRLRRLRICQRRQTEKNHSTKNALCTFQIVSLALVVYSSSRF